MCVARVDGVVLCVRSVCALRSLCFRGEPLASLTGAGSFILLLAFSRNENNCVHSFLGPHDHRRLSNTIAVVCRRQSCAEQAVRVARVGGCAVCPVCSFLSPLAKLGCSRLATTKAWFPRVRWFVLCCLLCTWYHATIAFVPRSIAMIVFCPSRAPSVVAHDARSKDSSVCGE